MTKKDLVIDCNDYVVLVQTESHPSERRTVVRDVAVGIDSARKLQQQLQRKFPGHLVRIFETNEARSMLHVT